MPTPSRTQTSSDSFWTAPNRHGNGSTVRSVIIKLRNCVDDYMQLYFMLADCRPSARNHLSLPDDDDCRAGQTPPWVVASLFLHPLPSRDTTYPKRNACSTQRKWKKTRTNERITQRRWQRQQPTNEPTSRCTCVFILFSFFFSSLSASNIFQSFHWHESVNLVDPEGLFFFFFFFLCL